MYDHEEESGKLVGGRVTSAPIATLIKTRRMRSQVDRESVLFYLACVMTVGALILNQAQALSLISEKCDPNKVGPDETTVKGGWQAEMFNGLSFRACG